MTRTALSFSGGGHRACVFALGALLYLADAERCRQVVSISSVSGGSVANGYVAQRLDLLSATREEVEAAVGDVARCVAGRGVLFGATITWIYLALLALVLVASALGPWLLPIALPLQLLVLLVGLLLVVPALALLRGIVCGRAFAATLFSPAGEPTRLADVHRGVDHVICATDLHAGEHVYFSGDFVCAYRFGLGVPGDLPLHAAVQASAAFPGAFPVRWLRTRRFRFQAGADGGERARWLALHDGGVYDNMADQWPRGLAARLRRWEQLTPGFREADELVVVNGSAGLGWSGARSLGLPLVGELAALLRDKSVLYDNGNSVRRQELVASFDLAERQREGMRGALVHIEQSPFRVPRRFAGDAAWPERAERAAAALALLQEGDVDERAWSDVARANAAVKTTFCGLGAATTARLLHHAYVLAMVNQHVLLGHPLLPLPSAERFDALAGGLVRR
ncbi:MAG TPA: patatin-like phospholipase family protein [Conexibacter sp.]|nr:patatin-like phospholipase family protein [Conexibacter sp.]